MTSNENSCRILPTFLILLAGFLIFLAVVLPQAARSPFYNDDYYSFLHIRDMAANPWVAWARDEDSRRHPMIYYLLFLEKSLWGAQVLGYYLVLFLIHFCNALLTARLCQKLFRNFTAGVLSGLLFLFSSSYYQILISSLPGRPLSLAFILLAAFCWIRFLDQGRMAFFLAALLSNILAFLSNEGAVVWPLLALFLAVVVRPGKLKLRSLFSVQILLFFLVNLLWCFFVFRGSPDRILRSTSLVLPDFGFVAAKVLSLAEMFLRPLLLPEKGFLPKTPWPESLVRLLPALVLLTLVFLFLGRKGRFRKFREGIPGNLFLFAFGWMGVTVSPYLFHALMFEHASRYLYFPGVGFSILAGVLGGGFFQLCRRERSCPGWFLAFIILGYVLILNGYSNAYHFKRYKAYVDRVPEEDYTERVHRILGAPLRA